MTEVEKRIQALSEELRQHNYSYYVLDEPSISDFEFDIKLKELQELELKHPEFADSNSPTQRVGGQITKNFNTITHQNRMYSLDNSYSKEDILDWEKRIQKILGDVILEFTCELKYDGASINLSYENGSFLKAVTRGDGFMGDEVTANVKTIRSIPLVLQGEKMTSFDIRGEIILPLDGFEQMNRDRIEAGEDPYRNPRNTASGSLKLQDSAEVSKRPLECLLYNIKGNRLGISTQFESLERAREMGFKVPSASKLVNSIDAVLEFINYWDTARHDLTYETDGVVVKVNDLQQQEELGFTADVPIYDPKTDEEEDRRNHFGYKYWETRQRKGISLFQAKKLMRERNYFAAMMVNEGEADSLITGYSRPYPTVVKPMIELIGKDKGVSRIAATNLMLTNQGPMFLADTTININPTAKDLAKISQMTYKIAKMFGMKPNIAMLSFSNFGSINTETSIKIKEAVTFIHRHYPDAIVDGEIQADFALNPEMLAKEFPFSKLNGKKVNVLIFPNLESANITYKLLKELNKSESIGPIMMGLRKPVHILQLGASVDEIVNMTAVAVVHAQQKGKEAH